MNRAIATVSRVLFTLFVLLGQTRAQEEPLAIYASRPVTQGVALAYPKSTILKLPSAIPDYLTFEAHLPATILISADGRVTKVTMEYVEDSLFAPAVDSVLKTIEFEPGLLGGTPVEQFIPAKLLVRPATRMLFLETPVTDSGRVVSAALYRQGLFMNGVQTPQPDRFPSYFCPLSNSDSLTVLPSVLFKVTLAASGTVRDIEVIRSTFPACTDLLRSAINWAAYRLVPKAGGRVSRSFYLSFVHHPAAKNPTERFELSKQDTRSADADLLLQFFPDTLGIMTPPLPRRLGCDSLIVGDAQNDMAGRICAAVFIDTLGIVQVMRSSRNEREAYSLLLKILKEYRFFPALAYDGRPRPFTGFLCIDLDRSSTVRIHLDWLPGQSPESFR